MDELLRNINWPISVLIFGIIFIFVFKNPISNFIARLRSVGKEGFLADSSPEIQTEKKQKETIQELMDVGVSVVRNEMEKLIIEDLRKKGLDTDGDTIKVLIRHLAATQIALDFEQIYGLLFGSQIFFLKKLNEVSGIGRDSKFVNEYFQRVHSRYPEAFKDWSLDAYLQILFQRTLLTLSNSNYHITNKGQEFLVWLARAGKNEDKAF